MRAVTVRDFRLLTAATAATLAIRIALWMLPFRVVRAAAARLIVPRCDISDPRPAVERIVWSVNVASRFIPRASCLTQSLAAQILLARHGYPAELRLGVAREGARFDAHAWVESDGRVVIGNANLWRYTLMVNASGR
jgi:hypothetical protein